MLRTIRIGAAAAALALAACSQEPPTQEPTDAAPVAAAAPDYGRGGMLTQTIDRIEQRRQQSAASGALSPAEAEAVSEELSAVRTTLTDLLSNTTGPLAQSDRQLIHQRLSMIESRIDRAPSP
jgi:uncharacterized lipoprotein YajG